MHKDPFSMKPLWNITTLEGYHEIGFMQYASHRFEEFLKDSLIE
jgi:hypothetical protein